LPNALLLVGAVGLLLRGSRLWWLTCAVGLAIPLFVLRDWLTQSVIMLAIATVGSLSLNRATVRATARWVVVATYGLAVFHKLNADFFDPTVSCAVDGWRQWAAFLPGLPLPTTGEALSVLPYLVIAGELMIGVLLVFRVRIALMVGVVFHLPLTMVMAPAFVFVLLVGFAAALSDADRKAAIDAVSSGRRRIALVVGALLAAVWLLGSFPGWDLALKQAWLLSIFVVTAEVVRRDGIHGPTVLPRTGRRSIVVAVVTLFLLNGLTPYLGTQMQHTGAMLSNLRVDEGCWNHLVVPESVRRVDPYIRIETASIGTSENFSETEDLLLRRLWSTTSLRQMRRNWCSDSQRPITLSGTFLGEPLVIADLCDESALLPSGPGVLGFGELFPDFLRLQKRLERVCPQRCLH
jgi:hypothetical protein